jgi:hypothetical protein
LVRGYVAASRPEPVKVEEVSTEKIFQDLQELLGGLHTVLTRKELPPRVTIPSTEQAVKARLTALLGPVWSARWKKSVNKKRRAAQAKAKQWGPTPRFASSSSKPSNDAKTRPSQVRRL